MMNAKKYTILTTYPGERSSSNIGDQLIDFYRECDLHVGYECHAHVGFFRQRRPSVLIAEDARGVGFNYTFGVGGFDGFRRAGHSIGRSPKEGGTSGYCVTKAEYEIAPAREDLAREVRRFLDEELDSGFRRYLGVADFIDEAYAKAMAPFLHSLAAARRRSQKE